MITDSTKIGLYKLGFVEFRDRIDKFISSGIPAEALMDISDFEIIFKSKKSRSFYNRDVFDGVKKRGWNGKGWQRISDHWNFKRKSTDKTLFKTDIEIKNEWAHGIFDIATGTFKIIKKYNSSNNEEKIYELKRKVEKWTDEGRISIDDIKSRMSILKQTINNW